LCWSWYFSIIEELSLTIYVLDGLSHASLCASDALAWTSFGSHSRLGVGFSACTFFTSSPKPRLQYLDPQYRSCYRVIYQVKGSLYCIISSPASTDRCSSHRTLDVNHPKISEITLALPRPYDESRFTFMQRQSRLFYIPLVIEIEIHFLSMDFCGLRPISPPSFVGILQIITQLYSLCKSPPMRGCRRIPIRLWRLYIYNSGIRWSLPITKYQE
jgi:hypothetical protein